MASPVQRIKTFYDETVQEVKKCSWPTRDELVESTFVVIIALALVTLFIWVVDLVCQFLVRNLVLG